MFVEDSNLKSLTKGAGVKLSVDLWVVAEEGLRGVFLQGFSVSVIN